MLPWGEGRDACLRGPSGIHSMEEGCQAFAWTEQKAQSSAETAGWPYAVWPHIRTRPGGPARPARPRHVAGPLPRPRRWNGPAAGQRLRQRRRLEADTPCCSTAAGPSGIRHPSLNSAGSPTGRWYGPALSEPGPALRSDARPAFLLGDPLPAGVGTVLVTVAAGTAVLQLAGEVAGRVSSVVMVVAHQAGRQRPRRRCAVPRPSARGCWSPGRGGGAGSCRVRGSESTAHAYTSAVVDLLAARTPGLLKTLREHEPDFVLLDGTLAECDRVGDGRANYSHEHRRHGVNAQVVTDPGGRSCCGSRLPCRAAPTT